MTNPSYRHGVPLRLKWVEIEVSARTFTFINYEQLEYGDMCTVAAICWVHKRQVAGNSLHFFTIGVINCPTSTALRKLLDFIL